ncbi:MAG: Gfo/Idh/MocA family oxidoreductase [Anaerolineae bacterium]|nr:Gfo/Idh/MocA family oxidoreductase [Anaerolineae bacterium]
MTRVRVGVIGVGMMGERHCRVYSSLRNVDFIGVADLDPDRGRTVAANYEAEYFADYRELLEKVDAVSIATTTQTHFCLAMDVLAHNVHVLVEKPLAETLEQGQQLVAEAGQRNRILQVGHIERFNPAYIELKHVIEGKRLIAINVQRLSSFDASNTDVDVIRDLMIHDLDLVSDLLGHDYEGLTAWGRSISTDATDHAVANLSFKNGPIVTLTASRITEQKIRSMEVISEGTYVEADLLGKTVMMHRRTFPQYVDNQAGKYRQESVIECIHVPMVEPLLLELRHFVDCVCTGAPTSVPGSDGLYALQLAYRVAEQVNRRNGCD